MTNTATTGNKGKGVRSDCHVTLELMTVGGIDIQVNSKVMALYGKSIIGLCEKIFQHYEIKHARLLLEDSGALELVIAARLEAAIRQLTGSEKEYLPAFCLKTIMKQARNRIGFQGFIFRATAQA